MKIILGIKIIWSNNRLLPKAENILIKGWEKWYNIGYSNKFNNYTYRWYPCIKINKTKITKNQLKNGNKTNKLS